MPIVFAILKVLAVFLAVAAALVIVALLLPLGFAIEYRPGRFRVSAVYGPLRRTVWSHRTHRRAHSAEPQKPVAPERKTTPDQPEPPDEKAKRTAAPPEPENQSFSSAETAPKEPDITKENVPLEEEEEELPPAAMGRLECMLSLLEEDPKTLGKCVLGHMRWLHQHSFFKMSVRQVDVFWTVTCEDAANTAIVYGAELAALNTALALVQQTVQVKSKRLWLEPDFTGARQAERKISFVVSASAILMIHLLYRFWKDPLLRPVQQPNPQTT